MKKMLMSLGLILLFTGCEDVIDVEVPTEEPRLVVNGIIRVTDVSQPIFPVEIKLSETNNFFDQTPVTSAERVLIILEKFSDDGSRIISSGFIELLEQEVGSGVYSPQGGGISTELLEDETIRFTMIITHNEKRYYATTKYVRVPAIDQIRQGTNTLLDEDSKEVIVSFTDNGERDNFYVFDFDFGEFSVSEDSFYQGQPFEFSYFYNKDIQSGQEVKVSILGADRGFYNYMNLLIEQTENNLGVFETPVATARGNIFDITGLNNIDIIDNVARPQSFPLGYFAVVQSFTETITIN